MSVVIHIQAVTPRKLAAVRREIASGAVGSLWKPALDKVWRFLRDRPGLWRHGHNVFVYRHPAQPGAPIVCDFGVEVTRAFEAEDEVYSTETPAGEAAIAIHRGPYSHLHESHAAVRDFVSANGRKLGGVSGEIYGDPRPDPASTETTLVYLLQ